MCRADNRSPPNAEGFTGRHWAVGRPLGECADTAIKAPGTVCLIARYSLISEAVFAGEWVESVAVCVDPIASIHRFGSSPKGQLADALQADLSGWDRSEE